VLAPGSGQEIADLTRKAFEYADKYRTPVMILQDGMMGQMMEPVIFPDPIDPSGLPPKPWILDGADGRPSRVIKSLLLDPLVEEALNWRLVARYEELSKEIQAAESYMTSDADLAVIAYGTAARIAKGAVKRARQAGLKVGLFRPITLWPFPKELLLEINKHIKNFLVFEMSTGQMVEDVRLSLEGAGRVHFYGRPGGPISTPHEIEGEIKKIYEKMV
jgi:2-oxoglutarate ferredoxin oxidoreductase subunit alpha